MKLILVIYEHSSFLYKLVLWMFYSIRIEGKI